MSSTDLSETLTPQYDAIITSFYALALITVGLRVYCRIKTGTKLWWDDWSIIVAMVFVTATYLFLMIYLRQYVGHHIFALGLQAYTPFLEGFYAVGFFYVFDIAFVKISILLFYWRIFAITARRQIIMSAVLVILMTLATFFLNMFQCSPVSYYWLRLTETGTCIAEQNFFLAFSIPNILTGFLLAILPLPHVFRLKLSLGRRLVLGGIFALGFFEVCISIIRLNLIYQLNENDPDLTYDLTPVCLWTAVEVSVSIVCACLPAMRLVLEALENVFNSRRMSFLSYLSYKRSGTGSSSTGASNTLKGTGTGVTGTIGTVTESTRRASIIQKKRLSSGIEKVAQSITGRGYQNITEKTTPRSMSAPTEDPIEMELHAKIRHGFNRAVSTDLPSPLTPARDPGRDVVKTKEVPNGRRSGLNMHPFESDLEANRAEAVTVRTTVEVQYEDV